MVEPRLTGLELSREFYAQAVRPLLMRARPGLRHTACLIGSGSEILGFDDPMSTDHGWGPRLQLFLTPGDYEAHGSALHERLRHELPYEFAGYATHFSEPNPDDNGSQVLISVDAGPINHAIEINTIRGYVQHHLQVDLEAELAPADWLAFSEQRLLTLTKGAVYHDDLDFAAVRHRFSYYPHDVWLYLLLAGWTRISQEEHLMGRAGYAGDELGSALIGARLVRDIMRLCFLLEKQYAPYPKWFGTAFKRLPGGRTLLPFLTEALAARTWQVREEHLVSAYEHLAQMYNGLGLAEPLPTQAVWFFNRPFRVISFNGYTNQLRALISDPRVQKMAARPIIGMIDQFSDSTDLLSYAGWHSLLRQLYD